MYIMKPYDDALRFIIENGERKSNRTGVDTLSVFGYQARYRIDQNFPILTKRKMFFQSVFKELLWIISGSTNVKDLEAMGSKIWTPWQDKEFEERNGYQEGDLGPIYGYQLRHFHQSYVGNFLDGDPEFDKFMKENAGGFDQLEYVVNELKTNRQSRRILFTYWNPPVVTTDRVKLPPCHHTFMLSVDNKNRLRGMLFQRSADFPIGVPANIQFYSALIYMLAQQCGNDLTPYELIHATADSHIYINQISAVEEYLSRTEIDSPTMKLIKAPSIEEYTPESFIIENYNPLDKMEIPVVI